MSAEVKRYDFNPHDGEAGMEESADGEYVKYEDYETLRLLAFNAKIDIAYALRVGYKAEDCGDHCHIECYWCQLRESLRKLEDAGV